MVEGAIITLLKRLFSLEKHYFTNQENSRIFKSFLYIVQYKNLGDFTQ